MDLLDLCEDLKVILLGMVSRGLSAERVDTLFIIFPYSITTCCLLLSLGITPSEYMYVASSFVPELTAAEPRRRAVKTVVGREKDARWLVSYAVRLLRLLLCLPANSRLQLSGASALSGV